MDLLAYLAPGRVHEACGAGRWGFACGLTAVLRGPLLWVQDGRRRDGLYPPGLVQWFDPARLVMVRPVGDVPVLQVMEEALRSGAAPLVIGDLGTAPDLTASRRLQLAAGTGGGRGLCLVPEGRLVTNAAETRWRCSPVPGPGHTRQHWEIVKNKRGRLGQWQMCWDGDAFVPQDHVVEPA